MKAAFHPILWLPRAVAILTSLFLALFAMDAWQGDAGFMDKLVDLLGHLLPAMICLLAMVVAWKREWLGALLFTGFAGSYAWYAHNHPDWILVISGPLLLIALLYVFAWHKRRRLTP